MIRETSRTRFMTHQAFVTTLKARLEALTAQSESERRYAIILIDLDRFYELNLALGRAVGDLLLDEVTARLSTVVHRNDLYRMGDDDYLLIAGSDQAADLDAMLVSIQQLFTLPFQLDSIECFMNVSVGVYEWDHPDRDMEYAIQMAGLALREAKKRGKNRVCRYDESIAPITRERIAMEAELRIAIATGQLVLYYQPRLELASGKVKCLEALVRWNHPSRGLIQPNDFIPLAEETGLISELGNWVLRQACEQKKLWMRMGDINSQIAVNISPVQFQDMDFAERIIAIIEDSGLTPDFLELEITESSIMHDIEKTVEVLEKLCRKGFSISIDDFGIGYSSLSYLKHFPIQCLKIDRSFVKNISSDSSDLAITHAIINLGHSLNLQVVAEGVEEAQQLEILKTTKCTTIQGFLLSPPKSPFDIERMFQEQQLVC